MTRPELTDAPGANAYVPPIVDQEEEAFAFWEAHDLAFGPYREMQAGAVLAGAVPEAWEKEL